jgi:hypothetical protein
VSENKLKVRGVVFDKICRRSGNFWARATQSGLGLKIMSSETPENNENVVEICWDLFENAGVSNDEARVLSKFLGTLIGGNYPRRQFLLPDFLEYCQKHCSDTFLQRIRERLSAEESQETKTDVPGIWPRFQRVMSSVLPGRKFFVTKRGFCGLGPRFLGEQDIVCIVFGCDLPLIIQPTEHPTHYRFIGDCFIHGLVDGEAIRDDPGWRNKVEEFIFI